MGEGKGLRAVVGSLFCAGCSIGVGLVLVGARVFDPELVSFQFVMSGIIVGVLVGAHGVLGRRWLGLVALGIYFLLLLLNKVEDPNTRVSFAVYVAVLYLGTLGGLLSDRFLPRLYFGKFVVWGALFGVLHLASVYFLGWVLSQTPEPGIAVTSARLGATIGAATGLGNELASAALSRGPRPKTPRGASN